MLAVSRTVIGARASRVRSIRNHPATSIPGCPSSLLPTASRAASLSSGSAAGLVFTPHLVPMTRGVLVTIYCRGNATTGECLDAARRFYAGRAFIRVTDKPPQTKWATGSNLAFVSYAADPERNLVIAMGVVDNLGKGAAGQAVQNANLICGLPETAGLDGAPVWP